MPNRSQILDHPQRAAIDALLIQGRSRRAVAAMFGLSKDAVNRYAESGMVRDQSGEDPRWIDTQTGDIYPSRDVFVEAVADRLGLGHDELKRHVSEGHDAADLTRGSAAARV